MKTVTFLKALPFAAATALAGAAYADGGVSLPAEAQALHGAQAEAGELLTEAEMETLAGGAGVTTAILTEQTLTAVNVGNAVIGDVVGSGQLSVGANAFSGYSGIGNFVMNTGHNNNLQSSMNVSIVLAPAGQ